MLGFHVVFRGLAGIREPFVQRDFLEQSDRKHLQQSVERSIQFEAFFDDGHQYVQGHRNLGLRLHGVRGCAVELLDAQVLLDPLEEQLDLPARLVQRANGHRRRTERVGGEDKRFLSAFADHAPGGVRFDALYIAAQRQA